MTARHLVARAGQADLAAPEAYAGHAQGLAGCTISMHCQAWAWRRIGSPGTSQVLWSCQ